MKKQNEAKKDDNTASVQAVEVERLVMCPTCGNNPATEPHSCPYAEEIGGNDDEEYCTCCNDCRHSCSMDI